MEVRVLANIVTRDVRTVSGQNVRHIGKETDLDPWNCTPVQVKEAMCTNVRKVDEQDKWRLPYLEKLLANRGEQLYDAMDTTELSALIDFLCVN